MTKKEHQKIILQAEQIELEKHKWIESEKAGFDVGEQSILEWVKKYGKIWRREFNQRKLEEAKKALDSIEGSINGDVKLRQLFKSCRELIDLVEDSLE